MYPLDTSPSASIDGPKSAQSISTLSPASASTSYKPLAHSPARNDTWPSRRRPSCSSIPSKGDTCQLQPPASSSSSAPPLPLAGYQCEGFRRQPALFQPGSAASTKGNSSNKRAKKSPDAESSNGARLKTEADSSNTNAYADMQASALGQPSFTSVGTGARKHGAIGQESLDMANSLAEFAGLATSSAAWPLVSHEQQHKDDRGGYRNGASSTSPSFDSFVHPSSMLPPSPHPSHRPGQQQQHPASSLHQPHNSNVPSIPLQSPMIPCEIVGDCLFSGHHLCASCSAVANRLMQPDPVQLAALDADLVQVQPMPSLSTPIASRHHSPAPHGQADGSHQANAKPRLVMESLIGYYSTLITCWTQGCDVRGLEASTLFRQLVPYLLEQVDRHPSLRLSIAALTAGYVGGTRLTWPKDVVAIHQWANTLRADRTSITDCVEANLSFPFPTTPDTIWSASPANSLSESQSGISALSPANAERLKRASSTHATLDDLLVGQAQTLKHLAVRSLEQAVSDYRAKFTRALGLSFTEKGFLAELRNANPLLLAAMNIAIYAFAEEGMESYFEEAARMRNLIDTLLGSFPPVNLSKLVSHEQLGFRTYVWSDVSTAIACGTRPHLQLARSSFVNDGDGFSVDASLGETQADLTFSLHDITLIALSDIARLRYDFDGGDFSLTARRAPGSPVPRWVHERAKRIQSRIENCKIEGSLATGSAICAMMTKSACIILIHTFIYRVGALHPVIRQLLRGMLKLWTTAGEQYCRSVGCSNFNLPMFVASSVAVDEEDRKICETAMQIVGHEEAGPAEGRKVIREVWRRTDITGVPCFWTDLIGSGDFAVAFY
ncbi:uncharacterized protein UHO2_03440 [Ustilago hordei]|uniref:Uncharacterized protein n=1 Tax=Ustilago hordei TaxID=120017 RepID=I2G1G3_USTHO|nr:uncharacterized protein UHO2_03440 [Ustilago hordei]KAJ1581105.1 hypothetical protein NDA15_004595 [Ustilago hordei]KAJ1582884.1 hypothetical protein NDA12_004935 [Ustilago hordei]CCF53006.1 uncharacterized protein UHOR_04407 [Ustilago hordei]SYW84243.1 uncharacterized protein UHO2_03440 [Ustilago hordei]